MRSRRAECWNPKECGRSRLCTKIDEGFCIVQVLFDESGKAVDYRFEVTNPAFVAQTGIENAEGRCMREVAPDHEDEWYELYGRVAETGEGIRLQKAARDLNHFYDVYAFRVGEPDERRVAILFKDISEQKTAEEELRQARDELEERVLERTAELQAQTTRLRKLAGELASAEHRERKRLAALLHDELQQYLVAAKMHASGAASHPTSLDNLNRLLDEAMTCSRHLTHQLRPPRAVRGRADSRPTLAGGRDAGASWTGSDGRRRR